MNMTNNIKKAVEGEKIGEDKHSEHWSLDGHSYMQVPKWLIAQLYKKGREDRDKELIDNDLTIESIEVDNELTMEILKEVEEAGIISHEEAWDEELDEYVFKITPSPRIDYCGECEIEHGYDCPKETEDKELVE